MSMYQRRGQQQSSTTSNNFPAPPSSNNDDCVVISVVPPPNTSILQSSSTPLLSASTTAETSKKSGPLSIISNHMQNLLGEEGSILSVVYQRLSVLISLLLLQSMSQIVLEAFESVVQSNIVIPLFLTMLVGAGGNAGNQSAVRAIAMLAKGEIPAGAKLVHTLPVIKREIQIGFVCALVLSFIAAFRVFIWRTLRDNSSGNSDTVNSNSNSNNNNDVGAGVAVTVFAISLSLFIIVSMSAMIGVILPFVFMKFHMNVEIAAPAIQVVMDIGGVLVTCVICSILLPSSSSSSSSSTSNGGT